jgi:hypothetical protein
MDAYVAYWKRGWWVWLMMLCINLGLAVVALPLAALFRGNPTVYWSSAVVAWLLVVAPYAGWVFERFAAGSERIRPLESGDAPTAV